MDLMTGAIAFQSLTFGGLFALLALDGNTNGTLSSYTCAHTSDGPNTYWMMQLGVRGVVGKVELYMRSDFSMFCSSYFIVVFPN